MISFPGAVKITPAHDRLDYNIAEKHTLPVINVIGEDGNMTDICKEFKVCDFMEKMTCTYIHLRTHS